MEYDHERENDAPARRWPNGDGGRRQLCLAEFTQEEIADKLGMHRWVVCRDLEWIRDSSCPGESPDVQEACFIQMETTMFNGGTVAVRPETPAVGKSNERRGGGRIVERKEDLRPARRWIWPPTEVISICKTTQNNADSRKCPQFREDSRKPPQIPASSSMLLFPFRDAETRRRGDAETRRRGDAETRGRGDTETGRRGDTETGRRGDAGTRGRGD
jgi:hypothetical protein